MFDRRGPWDRQHYRRSLQKPTQRYLGWTCTVGFGNSAQHFARDLASSQGEPGNKAEPMLLTTVHHIVPFTVGKAIPVLHRNDRDNSPRPLDVLLGNVG